MEQHLPAHVRVGIIGAGRVGRVLAHASRRAGLDVVAAWSRGEAGRRRLATELGIPAATSIDDAVHGCDVILIAVPDAQLRDVLADLATRIDATDAPLVVITSGSSSLELGNAIGEAGGRLVRIHPLQGITGTSPPDALDGVVAAITATTDANASAAHELARRLCLVPFDLADADATTWHAAGAIAAGGVTTLLAAARDLAIAVGMRPEEALAAMASLARTAIDRAVETSPEAALTGPIVRGDEETVASHMAALRATRPELVDAYASVARATTALARRSGRISDDAHDRIVAALEPAGTVPTWA